MSVAKIKSNIINEISTIDDLKKLEDLTEFLGIDMTKKEVYVFSEEQLKIVNESIAQYKAGNFMSDEEAEKDLQKWFEEQE